jgi:hypothetical protein
MSLTATAYIGFLIYIVMLVQKSRNIFLFFVLISFTQSIAIIYIGRDNILLYHLLFVILLVKISFEKQFQLSVFSDNPFFPFVIYCFISIFVVLFNTDVIVHTVGDVVGRGTFDFAKLTYQQFTQYLYLLFGFIVSCVSIYMLKTKTINSRIILKYVDISFLVAMIIALLQLILPLDFMNSIFRNATTVSYNTAGARISSTFKEPSFFALFASPLFFVYIRRLFTEQNLKYLMHIILGIIVFLLNYSSSFFVSTIFFIVSILIIRLLNLSHSREIKINTYKITIILLAFTVLVVLIVINLESFKNAVMTTVNKLNGSPGSGSARQYDLVYHLDLLRQHFFIGIGFGSLRSYSLLTSWLASLGIIGFSLYVIPAFRLLYRMLKINTAFSKDLFIMILVYNGIMFISVSEFAQLLIWILYGIAHFEASKYDSEVVNIGKHGVLNH